MHIIPARTNLRAVFTLNALKYSLNVSLFMCRLFKSFQYSEATFIIDKLTYTPIKWDNPTITQLEGGELNVFS